MVFLALRAVSTFLILVSLAAPSLSLACERGKSYLHQELQRCVNCTDCRQSHMALLRPCETHRDTLCGPLKDLVDMLQHHHRHEKHHHGDHHHHRDSKAEQLDGGAAAAPLEAVVTEAPFSNVETLVWDWQAIALTFAVLCCILFFLVIALFSLHQAKQWRRLKENFDADVEALSARLSLMAATSNDKGEVLEPSFGPVYDSNYLSNRCMYLEQLLHVRNDKKLNGECSGNVYIEESNSPSGGNSGGATIASKT